MWRGIVQKLLSTSLLRLSVALAFVSISANSVEATFTSDPVGCFPIELRTGADTPVGLPLVRPAVFTGRLASVEGSELVLESNPEWSADALVGSGESGEYHYCLVLNGELSGARFPILANGSNSFLVSAEGEDLTTLIPAEGPGAQVRILPYWTPDSAFAQSEMPDGSQLLLFEGDGSESVSGPCATLTYSAETGWSDEMGAAAGTRPLRDGRGFFVRLPEAAASTKLQVVGVVPMTTERHVFNGSLRQAGSAVCFALNQPEAIRLVEAGLEFADRTRVFAYDTENSSVWAPSQVYTYYEGYGWFDERYQPVADDAMIAPGEAYFVRIPRVREDCEWVWSRQPSYTTL